MNSFLIFQYSPHLKPQGVVFVYLSIIVLSYLIKQLCKPFKLCRLHNNTEFTIYKWTKHPRHKMTTSQQKHKAATLPRWAFEFCSIFPPKCPSVASSGLHFLGVFSPLYQLLGNWEHCHSAKQKVNVKRIFCKYSFNVTKQEIKWFMEWNSCFLLHEIDLTIPVEILHWLKCEQISLSVDKFDQNSRFRSLKAINAPNR